MTKGDVVDVSGVSAERRELFARWQGGEHFPPAAQVCRKDAVVCFAWVAGREPTACFELPGRTGALVDAGRLGKVLRERLVTIFGVRSDLPYFHETVDLEVAVFVDHGGWHVEEGRLRVLAAHTMPPGRPRCKIANLHLEPHPLLCDMRGMQLPGGARFASVGHYVAAMPWDDRPVHREIARWLSAAVAAARLRSLLLGTHARVGRASPVRLLSPDVLGMIAARLPAAISSEQTNIALHRHPDLFSLDPRRRAAAFDKFK